MTSEEDMYRTIADRVKAAPVGAPYDLTKQIAASRLNEVPTPTPAIQTIAERVNGLTQDIREYNARLSDLLDRLGIGENDSKASGAGHAVPEPYGMLAVVNSNLDDLSTAVYRSARLIEQLQKLV